MRHNRNTFHFVRPGVSVPHQGHPATVGWPRERVATLRVALLSYRSKPHCGGQGIYIRHLSRELVNLGHEVEVFSGQPYPELDAGVTLTKVPSLDLYREPDPFRVPKLARVPRPGGRRGVPHDVRGRLPGAEDVQHAAWRGCCASRVDDFDIVHDNQVLGYGMLDIEKLGLPLITTLHHPITFDRRIDLEARRTRAPQAHAAPLVRLPADAGQGRPPGAQDPHPVGVLAPRHRPGLRRRPGPDAGDPARRRRRLRAAHQAAGAGPDPGAWPAPTPR